MLISEKKGHNLLTISLTILTIVYPGWLYNNGVFDNPFYLPTLSLLLIASSFFSPLLSRTPNWHESKVRCLLASKDPILWSYLLFLGYILLQYINSGALRTYQSGQLTLEPLLYQYLPLSVNQIFARKALIWAFTGFAIIVAIRHGIPKKKYFIYLIIALLVNATLLAVLGLTQYSTNASKLFWKFDVEHDIFFSTFGYENNGGSFFILMSALALGGILYSIFNLKKNRVLPATYFTLLFCLFITSVFPTFTRFCYLESILLVGLLPLTILFLLVKKIAFKKWVSIIAILMLFTGSTTKEDRDNNQIIKDFKNITNINADVIKREFSVRTWQWEYTISIWKDYPWLGTGHDNMRYLQGWYARKNKHHLAMLKSPGKANTHNDGLQFLSEFGIVGFSLFFIPILLMLSEVFVFKAWKNGLVFGGLLGIALNALHSLIDLPYRNALVVFTTLALITCASTLFKPNIDNQDCVVGKRFKSIAILFIIVILALSGYSATGPFLQSHFMKDYEASSAEPLTKQLHYLNLADACWYSKASVKAEKAKLLYKSWQSNNSNTTLHAAALASHFAYFSDFTHIENALLYSEIMEKLNYKWEARIALKVLRNKYPRNEEIENTLYFYNLRNGHKVKRKNEFLLIK